LNDTASLRASQFSSLEGGYVTNCYSSALPPIGSSEGGGSDDDPIVVGKFFSPAELFRKSAKPRPGQVATTTEFGELNDSSTTLQCPSSVHSGGHIRDVFDAVAPSDSVASMHFDLSDDVDAQLAMTSV
jgi:hypothetical protein